MFKHSVFLALENEIMKKILFFIAIVFFFSCKYQKYVPDKPAPMEEKHVPPPPPQKEGYVYISGQFFWDKENAEWVYAPGRWVKLKPGYYWDPGEWVKKKHGWIWKKGRWRKKKKAMEELSKGEE